MIEIDGSFGEGGGQIIRTALALSTITRAPFHITNIRQGRDVPGLKNQHIYAIEALRKLCDAEVTGFEKGSTELTYTPGKIKAKLINLDIKTAGSMTLLLQALLLPSLFADKNMRIKIRGGSDVAWSIPVDYFNHVFLPQMRRYGKVDLSLLRRGYYPKGAGKIDIKISPRLHQGDAKIFSDFVKINTTAIDLTSRGELLMIKGISHASAMLSDAQVAERQGSAAKRVLLGQNVPVQMIESYSETLSSGTGITLWAICSLDEDDIDIARPIRLGADALGERGKRAEIVGESAAKELVSELESGAAVDKHLADNLVPLLGVFGGSIKVSEITDHTRTGVYVVEKFLGKCLEIDEEKRVLRSLN